MSGYAFSQSGYPRLIRSDNGDTVVQITVRQMDALNALKVTLNSSDSIIHYQTAMIGNMQLSIAQRDSAIVDLFKGIDIQTDRVLSGKEMLDKVSEALVKQDKKIRWLKVQRGILGAIIIVEAVVIILVSLN